MSFPWASEIVMQAAGTLLGEPICLGTSSGPFSQVGSTLICSITGRCASAGSKPTWLIILAGHRVCQEPQPAPPKVPTERFGSFEVFYQYRSFKTRT